MDRVETDTSLDSDYERDFFVWTQAQAAAIRARAMREGKTADIDWENVAEEIESLGRNECDTVESHLETVIEHLLKLLFSPASDPRGGWRVTVLKARYNLETKLSGSLSRHLRESVDRRYHRARRSAAFGLERDGLTLADLPETCPWTLEQLLDEDFWPESSAS